MVICGVMRLTRFRGHLPKGGYDVPNGEDEGPAATPDVLEGRRYSGTPDPPASPADHAIELARARNNDMDAATPMDAQTAPTGVWKSRNEREIPTAPTSINCLLMRKKERRPEPLRSTVHRIGSPPLPLSPTPLPLFPNSSPEMPKGARPYSLLRTLVRVCAHTAWRLTATGGRGPLERRAAGIADRPVWHAL
jgi:hypothetical protein